MKAAILKAFGQPLAIEDAPDPIAAGGELVIDVVAAPVLAYMGEVLSGARQYTLEPPVIPGAGAIGRVRALGPDATRLKIGDWVFCDPTVRSRDDPFAPDIALQGLSARGPGGLALQRYFPNGSYAEQVRVPTENASGIGDIEPGDAAKWGAIGRLLVPFGGWLRIGLQAGETALVNGATGAFGSGAVAMALALGAGRVVATGRNVRALEDLVRLYGPRVQTVTFSGEEARDREAMQAAAGRPIDAVFDILPPGANPAWVRAAVMAVRMNGRAVLMGGVGMQGGGGLDLPYAWLMRNGIALYGQWMYPREAPSRLAAMIHAGLINLDIYEITTFALDEANAAVAHAAEFAGPSRLTVLTP
jgi:alcohol dehydrogenase